MVSYHDKKEALSNLAIALNRLGWKLYGFKGNNSDMMTDYYDPAYWFGSATHPNFPDYVIVTDGATDSGKPITQTRYERGNDCKQCSGSGIHPSALNYEAALITPEKAHQNIEDFKRGVKVLFGGWAVSRNRYHENGDPKCDRCNGEGYLKDRITEEVDTHPTYSPTPRGKMWSLQKDSKVLKSGTGFDKCSNFNSGAEEAAKIAKEIHSLVKQLHSGTTNQAEPEQPIALTGSCTVSRNEDKDGLEIRFSEKPDQRIIDQLKALKFRWSRVNKCWYAKYSANLEAIAHEIARKLNGNTAEAPQPAVEAEQAIAQPEPITAPVEAHPLSVNITPEIEQAIAAIKAGHLQIPTDDVKRSTNDHGYLVIELGKYRAEVYKNAYGYGYSFTATCNGCELFHGHDTPAKQIKTAEKWAEAFIDRMQKRREADRAAVAEVEQAIATVEPEPAPTPEPQPAAPLPSIFGGDDDDEDEEEPQLAVEEVKPAIAPTAPVEQDPIAQTLAKLEEILRKTKREDGEPAHVTLMAVERLTKEAIAALNSAKPQPQPAKPERANLLSFADAQQNRIKGNQLDLLPKDVDQLELV